jgi:hypothetical protein
MICFLILLIPITLQKKTIVAANNISKVVETKVVHKVEIKSAINATSIGAH